MSVKCIICHKKCGVMSYQCKLCKNELCSLHRLPEDHCCPSLEKQKEHLKNELKKTMMQQQEEIKHNFTYKI